MNIVIFQHPVALYRSDLGGFGPSVQCHSLSFLHIPVLDTTCFGLTPSSGVRVVMVKDSAVRCNAVFFPPIVVASSYFGYVGCMANQHTT
jgi:hypothetical protein